MKPETTADREKEILFMDLRQMGEPFEKKYIQFSEADIQKVQALTTNGRCKGN
jgi:type I restriction enzyme M protein